MQKTVTLLAIAAGLIVLIIYILSGQSSFDQKSRELVNTDSSVEKVTVKNQDLGQKTLEVKCKDGTAYEIYYPEGETTYDALAASKC